jgi:hypothetical protein
MNTGLPRQTTVMRWPTSTGARSTPVEASASVSAAGFMLSMNGHAASAAPTTPTALVAINRKSRLVSPSSSCGGEVETISAMEGPRWSSFGAETDRRSFGPLQGKGRSQPVPPAEPLPVFS